MTSAPSELNKSSLVHNEVKLTVVCKTVRMLTLIGRPYFCVTRHTICSSTAEWSLDDGVLMLDRDVVL
eukprot:5390090-Amphidinium_carterae.1